PSSAISELQAAFGSILLSRKDRKDSTTTTTPTPLVYKWTGAFELFSFPRELRDNIYYHYLYRPNGVKYRRATSRAFPFDDSDSCTSLFVTCKQVYYEALQVFLRHNQIELIGRNHWRGRDHYDRALGGTLRLFPDKPADLLQRIRVKYQESSFMYMTYNWAQGVPTPGDVLIKILRDAYVFKDAFPKLREFTAIWLALPVYFAEKEGLHFENISEEEKTQVWLCWMKKWVAEKNVAPPKWVKFGFFDYWGDGEMQKHADAMNRAYARLAKDMAPSSDKNVELEESGRRWLEEMEGEARRKNGKRK
ncbi:hypothetical protein CC86DRAFT_251967, partial [Ophiobolus disseminans]